MPPVAAQPRPQGQRPPAPMKTGDQGQATGQFEQLHPRGRGGKWIVKPGAGTGAAGPDMTTAQLQQRLKQLGFNVTVDGQYGPATAAAVASFQTRYGLDPHGGVDAATMALMQNPPDQTLKQAQQTRGLTAKGTPKSTKSAKKGKTTRKVKGGSQTASTRVTGAVTARSLGNGSLAQGQGMTGAPNKNVQSLQKALTVAGYSTNQDGRFGPKTEEAVKQLQAAHGLTADGVVGPETKGLLIGLQSTKATPNKKVAAKKAKKTAPPKRLPGEVAVLRTKQPHARHGSRTAGSRMQLKPPAKAPATLKYHAENEEAPVPKIRRLEEGTWTGGNQIANTSTVAFGTGGGPSLSIKDGRDITPAADQPIWTRTGVHADAPDTLIRDGRELTAPAPANLTIQDGRDYDRTVALLAEAIEARKAAKTGEEFTRARAREILLRERLAEGFFKEALHPRGRGGKWTEVLGKMDVSKTGHESQALTPKTRHPTVHSFVVTPGSRKGKVHVSALMHHGGTTKTDREMSHDDAADWINGQMQMGEQAAAEVRSRGGSMGFAPGAQLKPGEKDPRVWSSNWGTPSTARRIRRSA